MDTTFRSPKPQGPAVTSFSTIASRSIPSKATSAAPADAACTKEAMSTDQDLNLPLRGVRIIEFEGLGPGPLAGRMLADMGAEVTAIVRPGPAVVAERLGGSGDNLLRDGTPRSWPGGLCGAQSASGLWPHDRLGPARPAVAGGRS